MEFKKNCNPKDKKGNLKMDSKHYNELMNLLGEHLEDITEDELISSYGITMHEFLNPTAQTITKVKKKLKK